MKGFAQNSPFSCYFENKFITFTPGSYIQFLPRCLGQEIRVWPPSSVPYHRRFISLLQRSCRPRRFTRKQKHALNVYLSRFGGFFAVCLSRTRIVYWNRSAVVLAYLSLSVSLGVAVEEEGEGWTIASTAPSVLGSSPRRDGPSPPPPSHSPSPSTQRAAALLSPSNHFATPRPPHFFRSLSLNTTEGDYFYSRRPTPSHLQRSLNPPNTLSGQRECIESQRFTGDCKIHATQSTHVFPSDFFYINLKPKLHKFYLETPDFHLKYKY